MKEPPMKHNRQIASQLGTGGLTTVTTTDDARRIGIHASSLWFRGTVVAAALVVGACAPPDDASTDETAVRGIAPSTAASQSGADIEIEAPAETEAGVVVVAVETAPFSVVRVTGGVLPLTLVTDDNGRAEGEVALFPNVANELTARLLGTDGHDLTASTMVSRTVTDASGVLAGTVVDEAGRAIGGATVSFGDSTTTSAPDGSFELSGVPDGRVVFHARHDGHLAGVGEATVADGHGEARPVRLTALVEGVEVGPEGGTIEGDGWRVEIPSGAVDEPTLVQATPLVYTGLKDSAGIPVLDLSPTGLTFDRPITVALDPQPFGLAGAEAAIVGFDPDRLELHELAARDHDGWMTVDLTTLHGMELRIDVQAAIDLWGGPGQWCRPFNQVQAFAANAYLHATLLPYLHVTIGETSMRAYDRFLDGGIVDASTWYLRDNHVDFLTAKENVDPMWDVIKSATTNLPPLMPPSLPTPFRLESADAERGYRDIDYSRVWSTPGNMAGGMSGAMMAGNYYADTRRFTGAGELHADADERGVIQDVDLTVEVRLQVRDAIDFCPSGMGGKGAGIEQLATIPLSRLEVTPNGDEGATWARRFLWSVSVDFGRRGLDVTEEFDNDLDDDGWPDTPPWRGWRDGPLDNCPEPNPDQTDSDDDGLGDVCDPVDDRDDDIDDEVPPPTIEDYPDVDCVAPQYRRSASELAGDALPFPVLGPEFGVVFLNPDGTLREATADGALIPVALGEPGAMITGSFFDDGDPARRVGTLTMTSGEFEFTGGHFAECATWDWLDDDGDRRTFHLLFVYPDDEPGAADITFVYGTAEFAPGASGIAEGDLEVMLSTMAGWSPERRALGHRQFDLGFFDGAIQHSTDATDVVRPAPGVITWQLRAPD